MSALSARLDDKSPAVRYFTVYALGEVCGRFQQTLQVGQRIEVNASMSGKNKGLRGTIARFTQDEQPEVLMDHGQLKAFNYRDITVLSEGVLGGLLKLQNDPHIGVKKAVAAVLMQRRNAEARLPCLAWRDPRNPKYNPVCMQSGRIPPSMRKTPTPEPPEAVAAERGRPTWRSEHGTTPVWLPVRPQPGRHFSPSPHIFSLPNSPAAAPERWLKVPHDARGEEDRSASPSCRHSGDCSPRPMPERPKSQGATPVFAAPQRPPGQPTRPRSQQGAVGRFPGQPPRPTSEQAGVGGRTPRRPKSSMA